MHLVFKFVVFIFAIAFLFFSRKPHETTFNFYVFSDTHCLDSLNRFKVLDSMIADANILYQADFPDSLSHLKKIKSNGVLVCGDLTDNGTEFQWNQFQQLFGLNGNKQLSMAVFENYGNHDGGVGGIVRSGIKARNPDREGLTNISENGLHYSWDWENFHFVSLGSYPGNEWDSTCDWCHYFKKSFREPENSLRFLAKDLARLSDKKKQLILYFHYGWDSFSLLWWTKAEQEAFYKVIKDYNVAAIFTGHNHGTGFMKWKGIDVYSAGSPQSGAKTGSYLMVQASKDSLHVLERKYNRWGSLSHKKALNY